MKELIGYGIFLAMIAQSSFGLIVLLIYLGVSSTALVFIILNCKRIYKKLSGIRFGRKKAI